MAVLFSLFVSGLKLRCPFIALPGTAPICWRAGDDFSIAGVCLVAHYLLGLPWGVALLIGAILAPTDPCWPGWWQVNHAQDFDRGALRSLRRGGTQRRHRFPFVLLGLLLLQHGELQWGWT